MTKANRKKIAKELLAAAERIELEFETACCLAIYNDDSCDYFRDIFQNDASSTPGHFSEYWFEGCNEDSYAEVRSRRVLGLCWAALMAEEGVF